MQMRWSIEYTYKWHACWSHSFLFPVVKNVEAKHGNCENVCNCLVPGPFIGSVIGYFLHKEIMCCLAELGD